MSGLIQEKEEPSYDFLTDISTNGFSDSLSLYDTLQPLTYSPTLNLSPFPYADMDEAQIPQTKQVEIPIIHYNHGRIGVLTAEQRREKVEKYLIKKHRRVFGKKVSYDCRKRVADGRIRIKGRFVTKERAKELASQLLTNNS